MRTSSPPNVKTGGVVVPITEGELTFEIGRGITTITVAAGGFLAAPPLVAHSFRTNGARPGTLITVPHAVPQPLHRRGEGPVRILTLHTPNSGS